MKYDIVINDVTRSVEFAPPQDESSRVTATIAGRGVEADVVNISPNRYSVLIDGQSVEVNVEETEKGLLLHLSGREFQVEIIDPRSWRGRRSGNIEAEGRQQVTASMPGKIVRVLVAQGQTVEAGQGLLVIEAMKMQNEIRSPKSGLLESLAAKEGQTVSAGEILAIIT